MDTVKPKRFSFAGFGSSLSRSLSFSNIVTTAKAKEEVEAAQEPEIKSQVVIEATAVVHKEDYTKQKRAQKTKSLYIRSFRKIATSEKAPPEYYDASEAVQSNSKEIRNTIRRSLSAVLYASPQSTLEKDEDNSGSNSHKLVPILVTPALSESTGGILIDQDNTTAITQEPKPNKDSTMKYDNTLDIYSDKKKETITISWQGYGYSINHSNRDNGANMDANNTSTDVILNDLQERFEMPLWKEYRGLIHPLNLFQEKTKSATTEDNEEEEENILDRERWIGLSVTELRRYYNNYGSLLLKIREARMVEHQRSCIQKENPI